MDLSTAILQLSENRGQKRIHDKWLNEKGCATNDVDSSKLSLTSFWGLFLICGIACLLALIVFFARVFCQYNKFSLEPTEQVEQVDQEIVPARSKRASRTPSFKNLIDFVDKREAEIKEMLGQKKKRRRSESLDLQSNSPI